MNYRTAYWLSLFLWLAGFILLILGGISALSARVQWPMYLGFLAIVAGIATDLLFYRCPHCGKSLISVRGSIPSFCPFCGRPLD